MTEALSLQGNLLRPTCPILCHHHGPLTEPLDQAPRLFFFFSLSHHSLCCPGGSGGGRTLRHMHFWYNQVCFLVKTTKHSDLSSTLWEIPTDLLREGMGRQRFSKIRTWSMSQSWSKCLRKDIKCGKQTKLLSWKTNYKVDGVCTFVSDSLPSHGL